MAMHKTNSLLKYVVPIILGLVVVLLLFHGSSEKPKQKMLEREISNSNTAAHDSAAESLDTLTAELSETKQKITEVSKNNEIVKNQNSELMEKMNAKNNDEVVQLTQEVQQLKEVVNQKKPQDEPDNKSQAITVVPDLTKMPSSKDRNPLNLFGNSETTAKNLTEDGKEKPIPYYTIPANGTSVKDRLMTALVGRIPVKGVVTDPYPFKIVVSDDNLAANGLRIPHLLQMIVSGYCEGDLNLVSVRGWITSLTFVFDDGTISMTTSNDNDIGNYTKSNSLGYLSDKYGNPFIRGKLITNAPTYLGGNVALGMATGAANAYTQKQTTSSSSLFGNNSTVTGSQEKYVTGQVLSNGASEAQQWWHDREQQSFDAIYVPSMDEQGKYVEIAVNFAKEIHIDYNPKGRKLSYAHDHDARIYHGLD